MKNFKTFGVILLIIMSLITSPFLNSFVYAEGDSQTPIIGTNQDEILVGTDEQGDVIDGGAGNDQIAGSEGNDVINGGDGDDVIFGNAGDDVLNGGSGNDEIYGDAGNDTAIYDVDSSNSTIQIGSNANGDLLLKIGNENEEDFLENVENLDFTDKQINDIAYVPLNGFLSNLQRNQDGTYTAYWGYENNNEYEAFNDVNYFEEGDTTLDNSDMIFEKGKHESAITTIIKGFVQRWFLGDKEIIADASGLEEEYQQGKNEDKARRELRIEELRMRLKYIQDLVERGILQNNVFTQQYIQGNISVGEFIDLLTRATNFDPKQLSAMEYKNNAEITKEQFAVIALTAFNVAPIDNPELRFTDHDKISDFAKGYAYAAHKQGIVSIIYVNGFPTFNPQDKVTREDAFRIISLYLASVK
jgi:hypothetical protein